MVQGLVLPDQPFIHLVKIHDRLSPNHFRVIAESSSLPIDQSSSYRLVEIPLRFILRVSILA
jgi:hypothetical protein